MAGQLDGRGPRWEGSWMEKDLDGRAAGWKRPRWEVSWMEEDLDGRAVGWKRT